MSFECDLRGGDVFRGTFLGFVFGGCLRGLCGSASGMSLPTFWACLFVCACVHSGSWPLSGFEAGFLAGCVQVSFSHAQPKKSSLQPWLQVHKVYHKLYRSILQERNYDDIFFLDLEGNCIYSVYKEKSRRSFSRSPCDKNTLVGGNWLKRGGSWKNAFSLHCGLFQSKGTGPHSQMLRLDFLAAFRRRSTQVAENWPSLSKLDSKRA